MDHLAEAKRLSEGASINVELVKMHALISIADTLKYPVSLPAMPEPAPQSWFDDGGT